jgi:16S rRNA (guanine966-N2)-methyltransferase
MSAIAAHLPGARVLDLFAGSGALGLEALSRGAEHVTFVEKGQPALRSLATNIETLGVPTTSLTIVRSDAIRFAEGLPVGSFDLAFADPPYGHGHAERLAGIFGARNFAEMLCIEHGIDEPLVGVAAVRERRYGDTLLTFLAADDGS